MLGILSSWVTRRGIVVLAIWAIVAGIMPFVAPPWEAVSRDDDVRFFPPNYPSVIGQELMERGFPDSAASSEAVFLSYRADGELTDDDRASLNRLTVRLRKLQEDEPNLAIKKVTDYREMVIGPRLVSDPTKSSEGQVACTRVAIAATYVSKRARLTVERLIAEQREARKDLPEGLRLEMSGSAVVGHNANSAALASASTTTYTTVALVVLILLVVYRAPLLALIPLVTIAISVWISVKSIALLTRMPWLNFQVIIVTNIFVVVVLFGAGTDYCLFLIARYREELARGLGHAEAIAESMRQVGGALVASAGTVIVGLGMLSFATFTKIQYTGPAIALALAISLLAGLTIAPILLRWFGDRVFWPFAPPSATPAAREASDEALRNTFWGRVADLVIRRPALILAVSLLVMAPLAWVGALSRSSFSVIADLEDNQPAVVGANIVRRHFPPGELGPTTLLLANDNLDFLSKEGRAAIGGLSEKLRALDGMAEVRSVSEPLGRVPQTRQERSALTLIRRQTDPRYVGAQGHVTRLELVFQHDPFALASHDLVARVREVAESAANEEGPLKGARVGLAGVTAQVLDLKRIITADERRMYVLVTAGVYLILLVLIRKPLICLYLILTVVLGYLASLGAAELLFKALHTGQTPWVGLDWKVGFFLFVILVAIGEDYNIFLMSRVIEEEAKHGPIEGCRRAVTTTGGIISSCGLIMAGTFGSMLSGRLTTLKEMGFALGLGVLLDTFIVRPVLVPAFLVLWHRLNPKARLESPIHEADAVAQGSASPS